MVCAIVMGEQILERAGGWFYPLHHFEKKKSWRKLLNQPLRYAITCAPIDNGGTVHSVAKDSFVCIIFAEYGGSCLYHIIYAEY
jgi:hypothetical protein